MPQESGNSNSNFTSPGKNLRGLKALISQNEAPYSYTDEIINDYELAHRKAEEAGPYYLIRMFNTLIFTTAIKLIFLQNVHKFLMLTQESTFTGNINAI